MARVMVAVAVGAGKSELQLDMHSNILSITPAATCRSPLDASTSNKECSAERSMLSDVLALPGRLHRSPRPVDARLHGQGAELPSRLVISPHATHMAHAKQTHNLARRHNYVPAHARTRRKLSMPHAHRCQDLGSCGFRPLYIGSMGLHDATDIRRIAVSSRAGCRRAWLSMDSHSWQSGSGRALGSSQRPPVDVGPPVTSLVGLLSYGACQLDDHQQSGNDCGLLAASGGRKLGCWSFVGAPASQALRQLNVDFIFNKRPLN